MQVFAATLGPRSDDMHGAHSSPSQLGTCHCLQDQFGKTCETGRGEVSQMKAGFFFWFGRCTMMPPKLQSSASLRTFMKVEFE